MRNSDSRNMEKSVRRYDSTLVVRSERRKERITALPESLVRDCGMELRPESSRHHNMVQSFLEMAIIGY